MSAQPSIDIRSPADARGAASVPILKTERLTLPHPELFNRAFVLVPLNEIAPDLVIGGVRVGEAAARLGAEAKQVLPLD